MAARLGLLLAGLCGSVHALYRQDSVLAFRVPDGKIAVDGTPERLWKALSQRQGAQSTISFQDYRTMVLLQPEQVRNADPSQYVKNPVNGYATLMAAYDNTALYFLFIVKTKTIANAKTLCTDAAEFWKADAPEIYLDPNLWVEDATSYRNYFSTDAGGLIYGTSPKTIQVGKPLDDKDTRVYFRNRATADKFQTVSAASAGILAVSKRHTPNSDTSVTAVEMKIPYWGGLGAANAGSKPFFISWGFNMYPDSLWSNCGGNPLAYRWAKHYLNYDAAQTKPPGWRAKDSTHYDPTRSWDGWGRFSMSNGTAVDSTECSKSAEKEWDVLNWKTSCHETATRLAAPAGRAVPSILDRNGFPIAGWRDLRGRSIKPGAGTYGVPWDAPRSAEPREGTAALPD
jgi:hypothetical protein